MNHTVPGNERPASQMLQKSYFLMIRKIIDLSRIPPALGEHHEWIIALEKQGKSSSPDRRSAGMGRHWAA